MVHFGVGAMSNFATPKEALLTSSIKPTSEKGIDALAIREIAKHGSISAGCVYNYSLSKASPVAATVEKI